MNDQEFFDIATLQYRLKNMTRKVKEFESGEKYVRMRQEFQSVFREQNRTIKRLENELAKAHAETVAVRKIWSEVMDELETGHKKEIESLQRENAGLIKRAVEAERQRDEALDKLRDRNRELYETKAALYEAEQKIDGLTARINKDYTNSSKPSSQSPSHKTIPNGREKSGRKPGGQRGHIHYPRKRAGVTETVEIPAPVKYTDDPNFKETGRDIKKQLIRLQAGIEVIEYKTPEFRNQTTGQRVHADFPDSITDDVTYDGTVKALAYLLNNECYVSIEKTRKFISEISGGKLNLSSGLICNLSRQFSEKTKEERNDIFLKLFASPALHCDFTFGRMNGKQTSVIICAAEDTVLYQGREKKGDEGVKGSPLEFYGGTLISDHEAALIKHGSRNQECMTHVKRHVISSMENEKNRTWNKQLKAWIEKAVSYWKSVSEGAANDPESVDGFLREYDGIMLTAQKEYEDEPPNEYFMDGYNLWKRMSGDKDRYVLFLKDTSVEPDNNLAERCARKFKRKSAQVMCFRSQSGVNRFCDGLSITESIKTRGENLYHAVSQRFNKGIGVCDW